MAPTRIPRFSTSESTAKCSAGSNVKESGVGLALVIG